ncbi:hypothetical protein C8J55DRAFT_494266 [Lentinula edodes]|uniref:Uncharacterized protein n=1 Tax=Lentinula lateritia TaxID=40482 RepID=A0A9W9DDD1_9AGAR|nr:hypothetical protein C8J55DRAFT_494266 [Lentinula edodes]
MAPDGTPRNKDDTSRTRSCSTGFPSGFFDNNFDGLNTIFQDSTGPSPDDWAFDQLIHSSEFQDTLMGLDLSDIGITGLGEPSLAVPDAFEHTGSINNRPISPPFQSESRPCFEGPTSMSANISNNSLILANASKNPDFSPPSFVDAPPTSLHSFKDTSLYASPTSPCLFQDAPLASPHLFDDTPPAFDETPPTTPKTPQLPSSSSNSASTNMVSTATLNRALENRSYLARQATTHAERNPLLPTQAIRARRSHHLDPVQSRTMNEAKAEKQRLDLLLKQDALKLMNEYEEMIAALAYKHSRTPEYVKALISTASHLSRQRATGRMQALVHIKSLEVNPSLPVGKKLKAPALRKLVEEDPELLALSDDKVEEAKKEVEAKRLLSTRGIRPTNASAGKDFSATSRLMNTEFDGLHVRTGAVGFGLLTPGTREDRGIPLWAPGALGKLTTHR